MFDNLQHETEPTQEASPLPQPDPDLQYFERLRDYVRMGRVPWRRVSSWKKEDLCNRALVQPRDVGFQGRTPFPLRAHRFVSNLDFQSMLRKRFATEITEAAIGDLQKISPHLSAAKVLSTTQRIALTGLILAFAYAFATAPLATIISLNAVITAYFLLTISYRAILIILGAKIRKAQSLTPALKEEDYPVITILLPLYDDANALAPLTRSIDALQYPAGKKDVKLLLEADDDETLAEARRLGLHEKFDVIPVPPGAPRTKPKACNFGVQMARGDLVVIYDAEDHPEPDQLIKAARMFAGADPALACVQAKLNYYNRDENWLARLFTLEYSLWFDWLLPALQKLRAPIPLGGTSNFFKTETLMKIGGWDPFNVTEDADLGLRLSQLGYRVEMLDSTTFEEANCEIGNWIRQRSRWMKGYLQTWLIHMRRPQNITRSTGWLGLLTIQLFIAGNVLSALINPILWTIFVVWLVTQAQIISLAFPEPLLTLNMFALVYGNLFFITLAVLAPFKRGWFGLSLFGLTAPFYWLLTSVAAYKALWQLIFRPHYWEKTDHVISEVAQQRRREALAYFQNAPTHSK